MVVSMPLEIGLIGATAIAERAMLRPSARHPDTVVQAVAASDSARAREYAARHGISTVHRDYAELLQDSRLNLVYISLHNAAHWRWAALAASAGKHVMVEKPLCLGVDELAAISAAADGVHVIEAVATAGHEWQAAVRAAIADGRHGALCSMRSEFRFAELDGTRGYRSRPELGGGIFFDTASYWLQAVQATIGLAGAIGEGRSAFDGPNRVDTTFHGSLTWPDGKTSTLDCSFGGRHVAEHEFVFERAVLRLRRALLPMAGAVPVNLMVRRDDGERTVVSFPVVGYYDRQFDRMRQLVLDGGDAWGAELSSAGDRVRVMAAIHHDAHSRYLRENR
jgi:predicted dehydrogenase